MFLIWQGIDLETCTPLARQSDADSDDDYVNGSRAIAVCTPSSFTSRTSDKPHPFQTIGTKTKLQVKREKEVCCHLFSENL